MPSMITTVGFGDAVSRFACVASVSIEQRAKTRTRFSAFCPREKWGESKNGKEEWGRGAKETLADKLLDFENLRSPANGARDWLG